MVERDKMAEYQCPRWQELPDLALYMDQVVAVLEKHLSPLHFLSEEKTVTSTMINNYVKSRLIPPPEKKRYSREHLAMLYICIILKQLLSLSELDSLLRYLRENDGIEVIYNHFCEELEQALHSVFGKDEAPVISAEASLLRRLTVSYALQLYSRSVLSSYAPKKEEQEISDPPKKKKKKKNEEAEEETT